MLIGGYRDRRCWLGLPAALPDGLGNLGSAYLNSYDLTVGEL